MTPLPSHCSRPGGREALLGKPGPAYEEGIKDMSRHHSLAELKEALEKFHGGVYLAAEYLGIWPSALYARIKKSPELRQVLDLFDGRRTDAAELKLEQAIYDGEAWAIQFQLRTKGRDRGYVERREVDNRGSVSIEVEPKVGPELNRAIERTLAVLAAGGEAGPSCSSEHLPQGFRPAD